MCHESSHSFRALLSESERANMNSEYDRHVRTGEESHNEGLLDQCTLAGTTLPGNDVLIWNPVGPRIPNCTHSAVVVNGHTDSVRIFSRWVAHLLYCCW